MGEKRHHAPETRYVSMSAETETGGVEMLLWLEYVLHKPNIENTISKQRRWDMGPS